MPQAFHELHWSRDLEIQEYLVPQSVPEALQMLAERRGTARVIAGGTDVVPELRRRDYGVTALVDISRIPEMDGIEQRGDDLLLGSLATHAAVAASPLIRERAPVLAEGCAAVGSPQIRNVATVAGNLVSGQPAADAGVALLALDATVTVASVDGQREVPLTEFFRDVGETVVDSSREILTRIQFKALGRNQGNCYLRLSKRKALALPMLVCAVVVETDPAQKRIREAAVALGPVAPIPQRAAEAEALLREAPVSRDSLEQAAQAAVAQCAPRDSLLRGSSEYRREMVKVFVRRGLAKALARAGVVMD